MDKAIMKKKKEGMFTFKKRIFTALCIVDSNNAFFIGYCEDILQVPGWWQMRDEGTHQLDG